MSDMNPLSHRIEKIHGRLSELYRHAIASPSPSPELLPTALIELGIVSEALQLVMNELARQNEKLASMQSNIDSEHQRYQELSELLLDGYIVTDAAFIIEELNSAAAALFNTQPQLLIGKPLPSLIFNEDRAAFQTKLSQIQQRHRVDLTVRFQRYHADFFSASVSVSTTQSFDNKTGFRWILRDVTERKRAESALDCADYDPCQDRPIQFYSKGDIIPLDPSKLWLVSRGVVKLSTMSDRGEEMLMGLVRDSMVFGSSLTALQTYEAIALSKVQLVSISLTEVSQSPRLAQVLLPLITQRLRQTESFLSIYGQLRVEDRLHHLLDLLKREIGQPVENGIRLCVRLTHQDFASACCTTRVTITRLLGKLQQEGNIMFDSHNHLILKH
ncbi:PAS domain S-box protein [Thermocoleostomius sinensis]|uniref:PAS domain S-box protein n=1 Tax=Thermocoleostomius sinensis A174 TaxID=2016057 RepID=A0A9E8Z857_9CYAN|nr:PAS domain S-box protein [Thermocoleostomius sinensis]WAL58255.1 PAS domain S-box protein [Thermocoleostomius sinensis A174]